MTKDLSSSARGLASLGSVFAASVGGPSIPPAVRARAYTRALAVLESGPAESTGAIAALGFAADMFLATAVELAANLPQQIELIAEINRVAGIPPLALGREVLGAPRLLQLPPRIACEVALKMLLAFADLRRAAIFTLDAEGALRLLVQAGDDEDGARDLRAHARELLDGEPSPARRRRGVAGTMVEQKQGHAYALVGRGSGADSTACELLLDAAVPLLAAALERGATLGRGLPSDNPDVATAERRLARLRYDLHDGPQQDVIMLADDLRLFSSQFASVYGESEHAEIVLGRLDDLQARLVTIDGDLRRIAAFVQSPFLHPEPLPQALAQLVDKFIERGGIEPTIELRGDFSELTDSQQITLLGLIRESLSNIREHSEAENVAIKLCVDDRGVRASVTDDGCGFDPEKMLVKAARSGHLGLVGMYERVRMLGGNTHIDSRPGGPTVISVSLPPRPAHSGRTGAASAKASSPSRTRRRRGAPA